MGTLEPVKAPATKADKAAGGEGSDAAKKDSSQGSESSENSQSSEASENTEGATGESVTTETSDISDTTKPDTDTTETDTDTTIGPSEPSNFTICAPQLLHLDRQGKPLWFNGWLLPNKFAEHKHQAPAKFEAYIREPREIRDPGAWQLHENNICCLTSEYKADFDEVEMNTLAMIMENGRRSGALRATEKLSV